MCGAYGYMGVKSQFEDFFKFLITGKTLKARYNIRPTQSVDEYIKGFPKEVQIILQTLRKAIHQSVPNLEEKISYQIPAFLLEGKYLVYFAGFKTHLSLYPFKTLPSSLKELEKYKSGAATLKFPIDKPLPLDLIKKLVQWKVVNK